MKRHHPRASLVAVSDGSWSTHKTKEWLSSIGTVVGYTYSLIDGQVFVSVLTDGQVKQKSVNMIKSIQRPHGKL